MSRTIRVAKYTGGGLFIVFGAYHVYRKQQNSSSLHLLSSNSTNNSNGLLQTHNVQNTCSQLPTRKYHLQQLRDRQFDVLVIGGGATGAGVCLDAATRGLRTAMVEADDFSSGTSSRSTKLIHGGVRYLQQAFMKLDYKQYLMVKEALDERSNLLKIAPHLAYALPIMLPIYHWYQVPYYWIGIKLYDLVAGKENLKTSYFLSKKNALELFPMLKKDRLCGALVYYDGAHNDARMNLCLALTAARRGANIANHCKVIDLLRDSDGRLNGALLQDVLSGEQFPIKAHSIVNATGPFTDNIRLMDDPLARRICQPSVGVHIVLPGYYSPENMGLLDPSTSDGRVIFFLPWQKFTIAGTTDRSCTVSSSPGPSEDDIQFILAEVKNYLTPEISVRRGDVLSAWAGIRPLVLDPSKQNTASLARNHIIEVSKSGLITIAGGKWTTYRKMAEDTIDTVLQQTPALQEHKENFLPVQTKQVFLEGADNWTDTLYIRLVQDYGIEVEVAKHLANTYGGNSSKVLELAQPSGKRWPVTGRRIHSELPYIEAEIRYSVANEYACTAVDMLARRLRISFQSVQAASESLDTVLKVMANELKWSREEIARQREEAVTFLQVQMGEGVNRELRDSLNVNLTKQEVNRYVKWFQSMDTGKAGFVTVNELRKNLQSFSGPSPTGEQPHTLSDEEIHSILSEMDVHSNGRLELGEFLQLMSALKTGAICQSSLAKFVEIASKRISVERSGGGL